MAKRKTTTKSSASTETAVANAVGDLVETAVKDNPLAIGKILLVVIALVAGIVIGFIGDRYLIQAAQPKITTEDISQQILEVSELATEELDYSGMVHYTEGNIKYLTEKAFTMTYTAKVKAGVDLSKADISVDGNTINVKLPKAEMQSIEIDPSSLQFQDEQRAILNWTDRTDTSEALQIAQDNAKDKVDENDLISKAQETSQKLIENLLHPFTLDGLNYTVNVTSAS